MTTKIPSTYNPQPLGYGYVTTTAALSLKTETSATLKTETNAVLLTGVVQIVGKSITNWSDTGA